MVQLVPLAILCKNRGMTDLIKQYDESGRFDFLEFSLENGVQSMILISLFTNKDDGVNRDVAGSRLGLNVGSLLWTLINEPKDQVVIQRAENYAREALQWLLDEKIAQSVNITAQGLNQDGILIKVQVQQAKNNRYRDLWNLTKNSTVDITANFKIDISFI